MRLCDLSGELPPLINILGVAWHRLYHPLQVVTLIATESSYSWPLYSPHHLSSTSCSICSLLGAAPKAKLTLESILEPPNMAAVQLPAGVPGSISSATLLTEDLEKPFLDDRQYRVIQLPNKLEVLLVHDPGTDKARSEEHT